MSGLARAAKKHWKRKVKAFKKYWKVVAIAVVAYFTAGLALGAMAPAAGTVAAGTGAAASGAGVMTTTVATAGSSAAAATAGAATVAGIETVTVTAAAAGGGISAAGAAGAIAGGAAAANAGGVSAAKPAPKPEPVQSQQPPAKPGMLEKAKAGWKEMSFGDKLLLAKAGVDVAAAAAAPSPEEEAAAAAKWQGAFYGATAAEADQFVRQQGKATQVAQTKPTGGGRQIVPTAEPLAPPGQTQQQAGPLQPNQRMQFESTAQQPEAAPPPAEQVTNVGGNRDLFAQRAPGVRYLV